MIPRATYKTRYLSIAMPRREGVYTKLALVGESGGFIELASVPGSPTTFGPIPRNTRAGVYRMIAVAVDNAAHCDFDAKVYIDMRTPAEKAKEAARCTT